MGWTRPDAIFRPHFSLWRKAGPGDVQTLRRPPLAWMPDRCVLVASTPSEGGSRYQELARLPISQAASQRKKTLGIIIAGYPELHRRPSHAANRILPLRRRSVHRIQREPLRSEEHTSELQSLMRITF